MSKNEAFWVTVYKEPINKSRGRNIALVGVLTMWKGVLIKECDLIEGMRYMIKEALLKNLVQSP